MRWEVSDCASSGVLEINLVASNMLTVAFQHHLHVELSSVTCQSLPKAAMDFELKAPRRNLADDECQGRRLPKPLLLNLVCQCGWESLYGPWLMANIMGMKGTSIIGDRYGRKSVRS